MAQLLRTKLQPPRLRDERVHRPGLYEGLSDFESGVVLVSAPPGFGKSTLVVEWLTAHGRPSAWYSLDRYDSDVGLFGEYLAEAITTLIGHDTGLLPLPGERTPETRTVVATLVNDLEDAPTGAAVVLDDFHQIEGEEVHDAVNYLADNLPDGVVLVIVTRADPPLPLERLRSQGRLQEIRGADLRFTEDEVGEYFRQTSGVVLTETERRTVAQRSEGWVSALQLVSLGPQGDEPPNPVGAFSVDQSHIAVYLLEEVLERVPPELAAFLLESAVLERFDVELCREVVGIDDSMTAIEELDRRNAFLIPLDDVSGWYRYHQLFAELLRARLRRADPDRHTYLLRTAAEACDRRGLADDAIGYALAAGDLTMAAAIVDRHAPTAIAAGRVAQLRSWLIQFPAPAGPAAHVVALGWAWCRIFEGNLEAAAELLDQVEHSHLSAFKTDLRPQLQIMRAMVTFQAGDPAAAEIHAREGLEGLARPSPYLECLGHVYVGRALHARAMREEARPHLERAAGLSERGNTLAAVNALFWLGAVDGDIGNLVAAEQTMRQAQKLAASASDLRGNPDPAAGFADIGLAFMRLNQLEPEDAVRLAERGSRLLTRSTSIDMMFRAFFVWAEALSLSGRFDDSDDVVVEGIGWLRGRRMSGGPLEAWLWLSQTRNLWRRGRLDQAGEMLERVLRRGLGGSNDDETRGFYEAAAALSHTLRKGEVEEARQQLAVLPPGAEGNAMFAIERSVLVAAVHELGDERRNAAKAIEEAVELALEGYRYQFSHVGPVIRPVLNRVAGRTKHDVFVRSILERLPVEAEFRRRGDLVDPLTDRELDVLAEIAAGYTNDQIAERLFISRGTVKRHASTIYLKLGVHHRAEAAARGRDLGLLR